MSCMSCSLQQGSSMVDVVDTMSVRGHIAVFKGKTALLPGQVVMSSMPLATRLLGDNHTGRCSVCMLRCPALFHCSQCKIVKYCSNICQKIDWKAGHKMECKHYEGWIERLGAGSQDLDDVCLATRVISQLKKPEFEYCKKLTRSDCGWDGGAGDELGLYDAEDSYPLPILCGRQHWSQAAEADITPTSADVERRSAIAGEVALATGVD